MTIHHVSSCTIPWYIWLSFNFSKKIPSNSQESCMPSEGCMPVYQNCWEYEKCGREPYGINVNKLGVCPAATETRLDGVHGGVNAGRACWVVAGTLCNGEVQGIFAHKYVTCKDCDFYQKVQQENFQDFQVSVSLLQKIRQV